MLLPFGKTKKPTCSEEDIRTGLRLGSGPAFENAVECLYRQCGAKTLRRLLQMGGSEADAEDVFQDAIIVLLRIFRDKDVVLTAPICSFLTGIARNILRNRWRDRPGTAEWKDVEAADTPDETLAEEEAAAFLRQHLLTECMAFLGEKCQGILDDFLAGVPMEEIALKYELKDAHVARQTKLRCIHQLKKCVREKWKASGF